MTKYPESEKLAEVADERNTIAEFLDYGPHTLCDADQFGRFMPIRQTTEAMLYEYFGIDPVKLEAERRQMLDSLRD